MYYGKIYFNDIANGPGCRTALFVSGCRNACKDCFNPQTWDFRYGHYYTPEIESDIIESLAPEHISGLTILGGEPLEPENQHDVLHLIKKVRNTYHDAKTIWIYTGFTWEELLSEDSRCKPFFVDDILAHTDVLVDGRFKPEYKDLRLRFRGSRNQRVIDVPQSLRPDTIEHQKIILSEYNQIRENGKWIPTWIDPPKYSDLT